MECPKCGFVQDQNPVECPRCGIVFAKFRDAEEDGRLIRSHTVPSALQADRARLRTDRDDLWRECRARALALPSTLLGARLAVKAAPGLVRMFSMWVHETGHAVSAWLCGYSAWPGPWFTPIASGRSITLTALLLVLLVFGAYCAWQRERWFWVAGATAVLVTTLCCTLLLTAAQARQLITFGGDGGCLVLGTALMLTVYARADHPLRRERLRWALLIFGALAFMDAYMIWSGSFDRLPFGEDERGLSDPSVLVEEFGWGVLLLVNRYVALARACFFVLAAEYVAGIIEPLRALRATQVDEPRHTFQVIRSGVRASD
jgi:hypothetical protein